MTLFPKTDYLLKRIHSVFDVDRNRIILFGGSRGNQIWMLSFDESYPVWILNRTSSPYNISSHACILSQGKYWSFGGTVNRIQFRTNVLSYDIANDEWYTNDPLYTGLSNGRAIEIDAEYGLILILGGESHHHEYGWSSVIPQLYNTSGEAALRAAIHG